MLRKHTSDNFMVSDERKSPEKICEHQTRVMPRAFFTMPRWYRYSQDVILRKINAYFRLKGMPEISEAGHCHGLAVLWLQRKSENCEHYFYRTVKRIIECPDDNLLEIGKEIESFYADINLAQEPANQRKVASVLDAKEVKIPSEARDKEFSPLEFLDFIREKVPTHTGMVIRSVTMKKHSIAIYRQGSRYSLFDSNYEDGQAKECSADQLFPEISKCFYDSFGIPAPSGQIPMEIDVVRPRYKLLANYPRPLLFTPSQLPSVNTFPPPPPEPSSRIYQH